MYLTPHRRQHQHSLISSGYVKLIAVRTRGDRHRRRCHRRRASFVTPIVARAFSLSLAFPSSTRRKPKRGMIIPVVDVAIVILVATFTPSPSRRPPPIVDALVAFDRRASRGEKRRNKYPSFFCIQIVSSVDDLSDRSTSSSQSRSTSLLDASTRRNSMCKMLPLRARSSPVPLPSPLLPFLPSRITRQEKITDDRPRANGTDSEKKKTEGYSSLSLELRAELSIGGTLASPVKRHLRSTLRHNVVPSSTG